MLYVSNTFVPHNHKLEEADVVYLGIPFTSTSIDKPADYGPIIVKSSLDMLEGLPNIKYCDLGEIMQVPGSYELTAERIKDTIREIKKRNPTAFPIFVGGEHTISLAVTETLKPRTIVQFDAHSDTLKEYLGVKKMQQTWAYHASKFAKIIQLGVIALNPREEKEINNLPNVTVMTIQEFIDSDVKLEEPVHVSIDIDVFDSSYVNVAFPEGEAKPEEVYKALEKINPASMDIVEIADNSLPSNTGFLAAKLIKKILNKKFPGNESVDTA